MKDDIDIRPEARAIARAIRSMLGKAKAAGVLNPYVYFESEGSVHLMDGDHYSQHGASDFSMPDRQAAAVASASVGEPYDVGAW